ncbi:hypothetical protein [Streptomyces sp. NPDC018833]|uniref:hypothetical protein n=1 Tax=Streptomyces sp. NPDC018833 TaxID=3365053 RepID=UPI003787A630
MEYTEYEQRHLDSLRELEEASQVRVYHMERGPIEVAVGDAGATFVKISSWRDLELDQELQRCFLRFEGISAHWRFDHQDVSFSGEFSVGHLAASLLTVGVDVDDEDATDEESRLYSELCLFDDQPRGGGDTFAALRIPPGTTSPEIWYHDGPLGLFKMDLDYCTYLDVLLATKGTYGWQHLFTDTEDSEAGIHVPTMKHMLDVFPAVFPDHDYTDLRTRLEERL